MPRIKATTAQLNRVTDMALDKTSMSMLNGSQGITTNPEIITDFTTSTDGIYTTINKTTGVITTGQAGTFVVDITTSFESSGVATYLIDVWVGAVDTGYGLQRKISNANDVGSGAGKYTGVVASGDLVTVKISVASGTPTATIENLVVTTSWSA